jgi:DNA-binding transcriptional LysR family regulator
MTTPPIKSGTLRQPLPDITVQQLAYLDAVSEASTWAEAAAGLGVSPSALSQGLAELERRVGVPLFDRDGRRRVLRDEARPVLAHARRVLAATHDLTAWAAEINEGRAGRLRVGMIDAAAVHWFPDTLRHFREQRPGLELNLHVASSASLLAGLIRGDLDVVVCVEPVAPLDGVATEPVLQESLDVYAPVDVDPEAADQPRRWGPWVMFPPGAHTRAVIETALTAAGAPFVVVAESHQPEVLREMVALGVGWTVLPESADVADHPRIRRVASQPIASRRIVVARRQTGGGVASGDLVAALTNAGRRMMRHTPG